jgi:hypothetical protein
MLYHVILGFCEFSIDQPVRERQGERTAAMAPTKAAKASSSTQQLAKAKGKGKAVVGAPAQPAQRTRKGKKAWRKNIDITAEEVALEEAREEERVTGLVVAVQRGQELIVYLAVNFQPRPTMTCL